MRKVVSFPIADVLVRKGMARIIEKDLVPTKALLEEFSRRFLKVCREAERLQWIMTESGVWVFKIREAGEIIDEMVREMVPYCSQQELREISFVVESLLFGDIVQVDIPEQA